MATFRLAYPAVIFHEMGAAGIRAWWDAIHEASSGGDPDLILPTDDPDDRGGPTHWGVSLRFLRRLTADEDGDGWMDGDLDQDGDIDAADLEELGPLEAEEMYRVQFWERYGYNVIGSQLIAGKTMDLSVNMGPGNAHRILQRAANAAGKAFAPRARDLTAGKASLFAVAENARRVLPLRVDGKIGPRSRTVIAGVPSFALLAQMREFAAERYLGIIARDPSQAKYARGWMNRAHF